MIDGLVHAQCAAFQTSPSWIVWIVWIWFRIVRLCRCVRLSAEYFDSRVYERLYVLLPPVHAGFDPVSNAASADIELFVPFGLPCWVEYEVKMD